MNFVQNTERGCLECKGCCETSGSKLSVHDWLCDIPEEEHATAYVEVQFKNTRKEYFLNEDHIPLEKGDIVAVEASPGHDIGMVTLSSFNYGNTAPGTAQSTKRFIASPAPTI